MSAPGTGTAHEAEAAYLAERRARLAGLAADAEARQREVWQLLPPSTRPYRCWTCGQRLNRVNGSGFCGKGCSTRAGEPGEQGMR